MNKFMGFVSVLAMVLCVACGPMPSAGDAGDSGVSSDARSDAGDPLVFPNAQDRYTGVRGDVQITGYQPARRNPMTGDMEDRRLIVSFPQDFQRAFDAWVNHVSSNPVLYMPNYHPNCGRAMLHIWNATNDFRFYMFANSNAHGAMGQPDSTFLFLDMNNQVIVLNAPWVRTSTDAVFTQFRIANLSDRFNFQLEFYEYSYVDSSIAGDECHYWPLARSNVFTSSL